MKQLTPVHYAIAGLTLFSMATGAPAIQPAIAQVVKNVAQKPQGQFADRIVKYMEAKGYQVSRKPGEVNIVYVEGADEDGTPNSNQSNHFNDRRIVFSFQDGQPKIVGNWLATVNPGVAFLGVNPKGLPHTMFGQYQSWQVGTHVGASGGSGHEALIQVAPVEVVRAWTGMRPSDAEIKKGKTFDGQSTFVERGEFGINQHWGYDYPPDDISKVSAGCLVGRSIDEHIKFMKTIKSDPRYRSDSSYLFFTAILPGVEL